MSMQPLENILATLQQQAAQLAMLTTQVQTLVVQVQSVYTAALSPALPTESAEFPAALDTASRDAFYKESTAANPTAGTSTVSPVEGQQGPDYVDPPIGGARPTGYPSGAGVGQRQIPSDPRRTEVGMGPLTGRNSDFI